MQGPHFIEVDLEVWSRKDLGALARAVEDKAIVLYAGKIRRKFLVSLEASARRSSPESRIRALLRLVRSLPPAARAAWRGADSRVFNIGYDSGEIVDLKDPRRAARPCETSLGPEILRAVAAVSGTITTTIYPPTREQPSPRQQP